MKEDKDIELLFSKAVKEFDGNEEMMARINSIIETSPKFEKINALNRMMEHRKRSNRISLCIALAAGLILGLSVIVCLRIYPAAVSGICEAVLSVTAGCAAISVAICSREIFDMRDCRCKDN